MTMRNRLMCSVAAVLTSATLLFGTPAEADAAGIRDRKMNDGYPSSYGDNDKGFYARYGTAYYDDETDTFVLYDSRKDGKSAVLVVWKKGHYKHRIRYWNPYGEGEWANRTHGWKENTKLRAKVCKGEFAKKGDGKKVITRCDEVTKFRS